MLSSLRCGAATSWSSRRSEIDEAYARVQSIWPDIALDRSTFIAYLDGRVSAATAGDALHIDHLYLACACARGDVAAIGHVDAAFVSPLGPLLADPEQPDAPVDDLLQTVRLHLFVGDENHPPRIAVYTGGSDLAVWIKVVALRIATGLRKRQARTATHEDEAALVLPVLAPSPELHRLKNVYREEFRAAFRVAFRSLSARERNLIRLQVLDRLGIGGMGALYRVHRATAARWVAHARAKLVRNVKQHLRDQLHVSRDELESIMRIIHSQIDISASAFLSESPPPT